MFGFFEPLPIAAGQLLSFTIATATGSVTFDTIIVAGAGNVPVVAVGGITLDGTTAAGVAVSGGKLLQRNLIPRNLLLRSLMRARLV